MKPSVVVASWAGYQAGPLLISTDHHGTADGKLQIFCRMLPSSWWVQDNWVNAQ